jgi:serine/threonine-protein kinase
MASHDRRYVLHRAIAAGGAATVHIGRLLAPGGFSRRVAIKRLHPALASEPEVAASFAEEARIASRLAHANIAAVLDVVSSEGELMIVMEYVHGESLSRLLMHARSSKTPPAVGIVAAVLIDALHGLHAVHEAHREDGTPLRLVHRDVSPQNVIVGTDGAARVVDFGIAKALASAQVTRDGSVKGKLPYMAPEQLLRRAIDRRVDVYAAGVMLWEALANRRLFAADDEPTLFSKVLEERVSQPSAWNNKVPPALDAIAMRAIERDPQKRFATARDMAIALEEAGTRAPLSVVGDWVTTAASEALAKRSALIAEMERDPVVTSEQHEVRAPQASIVIRDEEPAAAVTETHLLVARRRRGVIGAAIAAAIALVAIVIVWSATTRNGEPSAAGASPADTAAGPIATAGPIPPTTSEVTSAPEPQPPPTAVPAAVTAAKPAASMPRSGSSTSTRWCKVFDPEKKIFVMKPMRVARCP